MSRLELPIEGMTCEHCAGTVQGALEKVPGVRSANVNLDQQRAILDLDDGQTNREALVQAVRNAGYRVPDQVSSATSKSAVRAGPLASEPAIASTAQRAQARDEVLLNVEGMTCASCVARVETALSGVPGVRAARANLATNQAAVEFEPGRASVAAAVEAVRRSGYDAAPAQPAHMAGAEAATRGDRELAGWRRLLLVAIGLLIPIVALHFWAGKHWSAQAVQLVCATLLEFYVGWPYFVGAARRARHGSTNMDTLVAIGTLAAWAAGVYGLVIPSDHADHAPPMYLMDAGIILTFITLGKYLEARAKGRASAAIRKLLDLAPPLASVERQGRVVAVPPGEVAVGETMIVRPGDRVPLDALVSSGRSSLDESWLTGESMPVEKSPGSEILAGTINGQGSLSARVIRPAGETALARVVELVRRAQESKTEIQRLADRVVSWFVPAVLAIAALTLLAWGNLALLTAGRFPNDWFGGIESMVAVLVVACPCALGLATPTAILVASGRGAELGILIKEAHALEIAGRVSTVVLDKTGTVTLGQPTLVAAVPISGVSPDELLATAAAAEQLSAHPLAAAVHSAAREKGLKLPSVETLEVVPGAGVLARGSSGVLLVGNQRLLASHGVDLSSKSGEIERAIAAGQSPLLVAQDGRYLGLLVIADRVAPHSHEAIARLKSQGLRVMLLSGDVSAVAQRVAREVGIDEVRAEVRPDAKQSTISELRSTGQVVAMVGDGINDAPALAAADLGIAIGSGSDVAVEAADIVITGSDLRAVVRALNLARATLATIRQNLAWAFLYNVILIPVAAGALVPWFGVRLPAVAAAAAMALSSVSVVTNSLLLRARRFD